MGCFLNHMYMPYHNNVSPTSKSQMHTHHIYASKVFCLEPTTTVNSLVITFKTSVEELTSYNWNHTSGAIYPRVPTSPLFM